MNVVHAHVVQYNTEKAFDRVEKRFMWDVLDRFGLREEFIE